MALSYVLKIKAEDEGFKITNYAEYLDKYESDYEVDIASDGETGETDSTQLRM